MATFVLRRLVYTIVVMWLASVVVFAALRITPGDPTNFVTNPVQTKERKAAVRHQLGIDQPILHQFWRSQSQPLRLKRQKRVRQTVTITARTT